MKNAETLLRRTAFRLTALLHSSSFGDRALVEQTLAQVNRAESEAMMQVFRKWRTLVELLLSEACPRRAEPLPIIPGGHVVANNGAQEASP